MAKEITRQKWFEGIATGMIAASVIVFFWLPLLFVMPPGHDYRPMCSAPLSILIALSCLIYALVLGTWPIPDASHKKLRLYAVVFNLMPMIIFVSIVLGLYARGNYWSP